MLLSRIVDTAYGLIGAVTLLALGAGGLLAWRRDRNRRLLELSLACLALAATPMASVQRALGHLLGCCPVGWWPLADALALFFFGAVFRALLEQLGALSGRGVMPPLRWLAYLPAAAGVPVNLVVAVSGPQGSPRPLGIPLLEWLLLSCVALAAPVLALLFWRWLVGGQRPASPILVVGSTISLVITAAVELMRLPETLAAVVANLPHLTMAWTLALAAMRGGWMLGSGTVTYPLTRGITFTWLLVAVIGLALAGGWLIGATLPAVVQAPAAALTAAVLALGAWQAWPYLLRSWVPLAPPAPAGEPSPAEGNGLPDLSVLYPVLSPRELDVLRLLVEGAGTGEISRRLYVSANTTRTHLRNIYRKTGTSGRQELLSRLILRGER